MFRFVPKGGDFYNECFKIDRNMKFSVENASNFPGVSKSGHFSNFIVAYNNPGSGSLTVDPSVLLTFQNQKIVFLRYFFGFENLRSAIF